MPVVSALVLHPGPRGAPTMLLGLLRPTSRDGEAVVALVDAEGVPSAFAGVSGVGGVDGGPRGVARGLVHALEAGAGVAVLALLLLGHLAVLNVVHAVGAERLQVEGLAVGELVQHDVVHLVAVLALLVEAVVAAAGAAAPAADAAAVPVASAAGVTAQLAGAVLLEQSARYTV